MSRKGQKVTIRANAKAGYRFDGWSSDNGGSFVDSKAAATTFTMPAGNVTLTAAFVADGTPTDPNSNEEDGKGDNNTEGSGLIWIIVAIVGVLIAVVAGVLLMMNEKKKRAEDGDDGFDDYSDEDGGPNGGYSNTADTQEIERPDLERKANESKKSRPKKSKKKSNSAKFRAEDWDD